MKKYTFVNEHLLTKVHEELANVKVVVTGCKEMNDPQSPFIICP